MKTNSAILIIVLFISLSGCESFNGKGDIKYEDAIDQIDRFKSDMLNNSSGYAIMLESSYAARLGEVWIYDQCKDIIQNYSLSLMDLLTSNDYGPLEDPINSRSFEFSWKKEWSSKPSFSLDVKYEILEAALKATASIDKLSTIDFKISLSNPKYMRVKNISLLMDEYEDYLIANNSLSKGNAIISAVIMGNLKIEYIAYDERKNEIDINLTENINEIVEGLTLVQGTNYFRESSSTGGFTITEESGDLPTAFAIEYASVPDNLLDKPSINEMRDEICDGDQMIVSKKFVPGFCVSSGENVLDLTIEQGESDTDLFLFWTNKLDIPITYFRYNLIIRNRFNQILATKTLFSTNNINPGITMQIGDIDTRLPNFNHFELKDVEFELNIFEAKNGMAIICN